MQREILRTAKFKFGCGLLIIPLVLFTSKKLYCLFILQSFFSKMCFCYIKLPSPSTVTVRLCSRMVFAFMGGLPERLQRSLYSTQNTLLDGMVHVRDVIYLVFSLDQSKVFDIPQHFSKVFKLF